MSHRTKIILFIIGVIVIGSGAFAIRGVFSRHRVPEEFRDARAESVLIAERIVLLANQSKEDLEDIEREDQAQRYNVAVRVVENALDRNRKAREAAVGLSIQLERMTQAIPRVRPAQARLVAVEAVSSELTLVSRLINHNDYLFRLLGVLNEKFSGGGAGVDGRVKDLIANINGEIQSINDLNMKFADAMVQFDALTR